MRTVKVRDALRAGGTPLDRFRRFPVHIHRKVVPDRVSVHTHDHFELDLVLRGRLRNHHTAGELVVGPGSLMLGNAFESHGFSRIGAEPLEMVSVKFTAEVLPEGLLGPLLYPFVAGPPASRARLTPSAATGRALTEMLLMLSSRGPWREILHRQGLLAVLALVAENVPSRKADVSTAHLQLALQAASYLDAHLGEITEVRDLARAMEAAPSTLVEAFQKTFGRSPKAYAQSRRISHAQVLMARDGVSVTAAATTAGWNDLSAFYRAFRKQTGQGPREWLVRLREGTRSRPTSRDETRT